MHELIDPDEPKCLYCKSDLDTGLSSEYLMSTGIRSDVETLTCKKCRETFQIYSTQGLDGTTVIAGFAFSCKKLRVFLSYLKSDFYISKRGNDITTIPSFTVDFSDKKKLHEKLKTYIIFS